MKELIPLNWQSSIERLRDNISGAFERYLSKFKRNDVKDSMTWSPIFQSIGRGIELDETDDALIARLALPGLSSKDFKVEVTENRLVIRGGKEQSRKKERSGYLRFEGSQAAFAQALSLPCEIDRERVKARFKNGLLTVTLPKGKAARSRRIKISVNA